MSAARDRFDGRSVGFDPKVRDPEPHRLLEARPFDQSAAVAAPEVYPVVQAPLWRVDAAFERARLKPGEQHLAHLDHAIAITVGQIDDVRGARHDDPAARRADAVTRRQPVCEDGGGVHSPIAVRVGEPPYRAIGLLHGLDLRLFVRRDTAHLMIQHAGLVQLLHIEVAFIVVAVQFADE